ncbi:MAG: fibronectin type III domain-containing protein [Candidatus Shapirobacteria bacterium]
MNNNQPLAAAPVESPPAQPTQPEAKPKKNLKTIIIVLLLFVAGIASVLGINKVKNYLGGAAADEEPKNVQATALDTSATISWQTDKSVLGTVEYGTNQASMLLRAPESAPSATHRIALSPLKSDTVYYYRIRIGETLYDNNGLPFSFRTKAAAAAPTIAPIVSPTAAPTIASGSCELIQVCNQTDFEGEMGGTDCQYDFDENGIVNTRDWIECLKINR